LVVIKNKLKNEFESGENATRDESTNFVQMNDDEAYQPRIHIIQRYNTVTK